MCVAKPPYYGPSTSFFGEDLRRVFYQPETAAWGWVCSCHARATEFGYSSSDEAWAAALSHDEREHPS